MKARRTASAAARKATALRNDAALISNTTHQAHAPKQHRVSAASLYPSNAVVLFWACVAATRSAVLLALATMAIHPLVLLFAERFGLTDDAKTVFFALGLGLHSLCIFGGGGFFYLCDKYGWLQQYKMPNLSADSKHEKKQQQQSSSANAPGLLARAMVVVLVYHVVVRVALCELLWRLAPYPSVRTELPAFALLFQHFFVNYFAGELFNYVWHAATHRVPLMAAWHNAHHEFVESHAIAAEHSGMMELAVYTTLSYLHTASLPMAVHLCTIVWKCAENIEVHSEYNFKNSLLSRIGLLYAQRSEFHIWHHRNGDKKGPYGKPVLFDCLFRTCDDYLLWLHKQGRTIMDA